jgi:hypothetical protein
MSSEIDEPVQNKQFPSHGDLADAGKHAATLALHRYRPGRGFVPAEGEPTGTVTFLEIDGKTYALTAAHVIDILNKAASECGMPHGSFIAPKEPGVSISGPFLVPPKDLAARCPPDVALRPIAAELPGHIGKTAFVVREDNCAPEQITHGQAVGFPSLCKADVSDRRGIYSAMQCVHAVAEFVHESADQVIFRSHIADFPKTASLSGMSGGPVFWSDEGNYGLAGIVIEAADAAPEESLFNFPMVQFIAQRVDYQTLLDWADYADRHWQIERDKINARLARDA